MLLIQFTERGKTLEGSYKTNAMICRHPVPCSCKTNGLKWDVLNQPPYSTDMVSYYYYLIMHMKKWVGSQCNGDDEDLEITVTRKHRRGILMLMKFINY